MADSPPSQVFAYLTQPEVRFLDAAMDRLIPEDELGPGAKAAGVTTYIDRQLAGMWGSHGRNYRSGPWHDGTPQQGYQSRLTPQELYRAAIRETDAHCIKTYGKAFAFLAGEQQDEVIRALEQNKIELESVGARVFFELLWRNTEEGFFSDPLYGGNHDKIGWKLIGFPGVASSEYAEAMLKGDRYEVEPVSILDIEERRVKVDAQSYPIHIRLKK
jgi:gluconate 2-dehydrogenase gamma chain